MHAELGILNSILIIAVLQSENWRTFLLKNGLFLVPLFGWKVSACDIWAIALQKIYEIISLCPKSSKANFIST